VEEAAAARHSQLSRGQPVSAQLLGRPQPALCPPLRGRTLSPATANVAATGCDLLPEAGAGGEPGLGGQPQRAFAATGAAEPALRRASSRVGQFEFFQAWKIYPPMLATAEVQPHLPPLIGREGLLPVIPWRVALQQSPPAIGISQ
jgi:hypothetical protein